MPSVFSRRPLLSVIVASLTIYFLWHSVFQRSNKIEPETTSSQRMKEWSPQESETMHDPHDAGLMVARILQQNRVVIFSKVTKTVT